MPSTETVEVRTCPIDGERTCTGNKDRTYFDESGQGITLCRQCVTEVGTGMVVDAAEDGADLENIFRHIMTDIATRRLRAEKDQ